MMMNNIQWKMDKCFLVIWMLLLVEPLLINCDKNDEVKYATDVGDSCKSHRKCKNLKYAECRGNRCQCLPNYESSYFGGCRGRINATCDSDYDCQNREDLGCIFNTCQRYIDFFTPSNAENIKLYRATGLGAGCETDENCSELYNTVCKSGKCTCARGYWEDDEVCKPVTNVTCTEDSDCKESGTYCLLNNCMLPTNFFVESNSVNASLYAAKKIDDVCQTDDHCRNINNSECVYEACYCVFGSVRFDVEDHDECQQILNMPCTSNDDCHPFISAKCFSNTCLMPDEFFVPSNTHNVSLYAASYPQDVCQTDHHCRNVENSHCVDGRCECLEGSLHHSYKCHKLSDISCTDESKCATYGPDVYCFSNLCQNQRLYFKSADINQYTAKHIRGYCKFDRHCLELNNTECRDSSCYCKTGYSYQNGQCEKDPPADCSKNHRCERSNEYCLSGLCQTPSDFFGSLSAEALELYAADRIDGPCKTDHHCRHVNNTQCLDGKCSCLSNWEEISNVCQQTLGMTCSEDSDCLRARARCYLNTCLLPEKFFNPLSPYQPHLYAAKRIGIYETCDNDNHCRNLNNTHCKDRACECLSGYENVDDNCQKAINVTCSDDSDCLLPRSFCFLNTCLYPEDFLAPSNGYNTSLYAAKRIDGFCQTNHHCREIDNSRCFRRRCSCKDGYRPNANRCDVVTIRT